MYGDVKARFGLSQTVEELLDFDDLFRCEYFKNLHDLKLNEGVLTLLQALRLSGMKLAVATSSSTTLAHVLLERCGILSLFDSVVTTAEAGKSKPFPDVYLMAARNIGAEAGNCLVFEDSPNGLKAAQSAGMFGVAVQTDHVNVAELQNANYLLESFREVTPLKIYEIFSSNHAVK